MPGPKPVSTLALNARSVAEAIRFRPQVVLSAHIVTSPASAAIRRALRIPVVQYFYGKEIGSRPRLARFASRNADASIVISRYTHDLVVGAGGPPERLHKIHPGVDLPESDADGQHADRPTILTIARLEDRYKGHDVLVRAMPLVRARLPRAQWVVIGDGPLRASIAELVAAHNLGEDAVRFLGAASDATRNEWLARAHVFAMPSRLPAGRFAGEGFGIVYLEANAHGLPVVAGNVAGAIDAVVHGETGATVDPRDHVAVADALIELLSDRAMAQRLGSKGATRAREFTWDVIGQQVEELLMSVSYRGG
jgi:phosphatidyl-myo-inositol dimannoside synthase